MEAEKKVEWKRKSKRHFDERVKHIQNYNAPVGNVIRYTAALGMFLFVAPRLFSCHPLDCLSNVVRSDLR